jgi:hypothetical protein
MLHISLQECGREGHNIGITLTQFTGIRHERKYYGRISRSSFAIGKQRVNLLSS